MGDALTVGRGIRAARGVVRGDQAAAELSEYPKSRECASRGEAYGNFSRCERRWM